MFFNARSFSWFADARQDVRHATRLLRRNPAVTIVATVSLTMSSF